MIKKSPNIVFTCKFVFALNHIDRNIKCSDNLAKIKINGMFNYFSNIKKRAITMFDYYAGKINKIDHANLVLENGKYATDEDIKKRKKEYLKYFQNANLYQGIISFNNDYIDNSIELSNLEQIISKEVMPKFLKYCGFSDIKDMSYQIALHTNTKHYHFHISFIEKKPNYISSDGNLRYRRKGLLSDDERNFMKREISHAISRHKEFTPLVITTNRQIEELKKYFKPTERNFILRNTDDVILEENILYLGKLLYEKRKNKNTRIKYNSINDEEIKRLTKNIKNYLFKNKKSELYNKEKDFKETLKKINNYFFEINIENNIRKKKYKSDYVKTKEEYIENYIYNAIVNNASYRFSKLKKNKAYLTDKEIIQEAVLKMYKKNRRQSRYDILINYLSNTSESNQFRNRYKIEQSIKKINEEMDDAIRDFSKLFETNDYSNNI